MKKVTVVYEDYDKVSQKTLHREQQGWQINSRLIMELDSEGPFFSSYPEDITGDAVESEAAAATFAVTIPIDAGKALAALDADSVASMTIAELGVFLTEHSKKSER
ncbi:hypothetical protein CSV75_15920 [Sporosarcina sp. P18a]|uniref:hypothetical protein n=1 Tax=Bacillales TaxID=1385 RepID=UPI000C16ACAA|nr:MULTISPECIES: hypothetical protein [Bacillales]PIC78629.1 hypothetical protein CSV75_15920 [Sporosarcina sp. P18a]PLS14582.1 hypothetical protein CVD28_27440 [Bacillus sp. M6-12]